MGSSAIHNGVAILDQAVSGGGQACGRQISGIAVGAAADLVELDPSVSRLGARGPDQTVDSWIFSSPGNSIRSVVARGRQVITEGKHVSEASATEIFFKTLQQLSDRGLT